MPPRTVHPRGCGEHKVLAPRFLLLCGSSPRVRGTLQLQIFHLLFHRFIPAGAGNTICLCMALTRASVHPRGCGEHQDHAAERFLRSGSSPRVRGTHISFSQSKTSKRFIPAGAGNTSGQVVVQSSSSVHPRGCGEHVFDTYESALACGSSPRVRGTPRSTSPTAARFRFIPAGAGNTRLFSSKVLLSTVHPRGCGEHKEPISSLIEGCGSSPRVRGTPQRIMSQETSARFIPAGAGNTPSSTRTGNAPTVHPRGCGEHWTPGLPRSGLPGSSPRVRGTRSRSP